VYRGRGPIQLTGRSNYTQFAKDMFEDWENVVANPDWVTADRDFALMSAIWFWNKNGLNKFADESSSGESPAFITLTKRINGGTIGLADRQHHYDDALKLLA
jgi:putative chitinase